MPRDSKSSAPPAAMQAGAPEAWWRRTPPAVFPPILGFFGLGLAWRAAGDGSGAVAALGELLLGAGALLYLGVLAIWLAKPLHRPGIVLDELKVLPGRAGLAAMTLSGLLLAAALAPHAPSLATMVSVVAFVAHAGLAALVIHLIVNGPEEVRVVTPVWHLLFVGFIMAPLTWTQLGYYEASLAVLYATLPVACVIWGFSAWLFVRARPPAPLRPLLAIHIAPASLLSAAAAELGLHLLAAILLGMATLVLLALVASARWVTESGFSPFWSAFTFPTAAFAGALWLLTDMGVPLRFIASLVLTGATIAIPVILVKILRMWLRGELAQRTNAARV